MPKKKNKAGQDQNYVPAGNGDASGEYADNETGSNRNFANFKAPDNNEEIVEEVKKDEKKYYENFDSMVNWGFEDNYSFGEHLRKTFDTGTDEAKELVDNAIGNGVNVVKSEGTNAFYSTDGAVVNLRYTDVGETGKYSSHVKGDTFYHEFWHCLDNIHASGLNYINKLVDENDLKHVVESLKSSRGLTSYIKAHQLSRFLSTGKVLSNGKTLYETLKGECRKLSTRKDGFSSWDRILEEYRNIVENTVDEKYPNWRELENRRRIIEGEVRRTLIDNGYSVFSEEYHNKRNELLNSNTEYIELKDKFNEKTNYSIEVENDLRKSGWMSISDMYGIYKKVAYGFCGGHKGSYSNNLPGAIALEFMAEFGSAKSRSDKYAKNELELFKKYFPETSKAGEELYNMVVNNFKNRS